MVEKTTDLSYDDFLEESSDGSLVGKDPRKVSASIRCSEFWEKSPIKAIRSHCIECSGGVEREVRKCTVVDCPLWPLRMGKNVLDSRFGVTTDATFGREKNGST